MKKLRDTPGPRTSDGAQKRRLGFFAVGALYYLPTTAFVGFLYADGVIGAGVLSATLAIQVLVNLAVLGAFLSGLNLRVTRDRTLAIPQMVMGVAANWWILAIAGPWRGSYLVFCITPLLFGALKLRLGPLLKLVLFALAGHLLMLVALHAWDPGAYHPKVEAVRWSMLTCEMLLAAGVAALVNGLRRRLVDAHAEADRLARSDPLTGVLNRRAILEAVEAMATRETDRSLPVVAVMDLDRFKAINDAYGHEVGDRLLVAFAGAVRGCVRDGDAFGRYGGDEFVLCLRAPLAEHAHEVLERIEHAVTELELRDYPEISCSVSIGATRLRAGEQPLAALQRADALLYSAKRSGRGRTAFDERAGGEAARAPAPRGAATPVMLEV